MTATPTPRERQLLAALSRRFAKVARRAESIARRYASQREKLRARQRKALRANNTTALAKIKAELQTRAKEHRGALAALRREGGCPRPTARCQKSCALSLEGAVCGRDAGLALPSASGPPREIVARYCLVPAEALTPSHDPITWGKHPAYPADTQERRYESDPAEQLKIVSIAQSLKPAIVVAATAGALEGPPVVTRTGIVLGGNGRTMGLQRAYRTGLGDVYLSYLRRQVADFGFAEADVDRLHQPVLVRVIDAKPKDWARLVRDLNLTTTQSLDPLAEAMSAARVLTPTTLEALAADLQGDEALGEFLASRRSLGFVRSLQDAGVITSANRNRLLDQSLLSDDGRRLVIAQLAAALVGDVQVLDALGAQTRAALARSAPWWLSGSAVAAYDVRVPFGRACRDLVALRQADLTLSQWRRQLTMLSTPATAGDPAAEAALGLLYTLAAKPILLTNAAKRFDRFVAQIGRPVLFAADDLDVLAQRKPPPQLGEVLAAVQKET